MRMFVNISIGLALGFGTFAIVLITIFVYRYLKEKMVTAQPAPPSQTNKQVDSRIAKMLVFYFTLFLFYVILVIVASVYTEANGIRWNFLVLVLAVCHMVAGWKVIGPREQAIMVVFGWVVKKLNSGPVFIPWPAHKIPFTKLNIKVDFGTALDPETKEKARAAEDSEGLYVLEEPIRINWGDLDSYQGPLTAAERASYLNDPYADRITTDPHIFIRMKITDPIALYTEVGGTEEAIDGVRDTCIHVIQGLAGKTFVAKAITEIDEISEVLREEVENLVGDPDAVRLGRSKTPVSWGINILEVKIKDLGTPRRTNIAVAERAKLVAEADGQATAKSRVAQGEKDRLTREGEGRAAAKMIEADAERHRLEQEGEGQAMAARLNAKVAATKGGRVVFATQAFERGLQYGKTVIIPAEMSGVMSTVLGAQAAWEAGKDKEKKEPPTVPSAPAPTPVPQTPLPPPAPARPASRTPRKGGKKP